MSALACADPAAVFKPSLAHGRLCEKIPPEFTTYGTPERAEFFMFERGAWRKARANLRMRLRAFAGTPVASEGHGAPPPAAAS